MVFFIFSGDIVSCFCGGIFPIFDAVFIRLKRSWISFSLLHYPSMHHKKLLERCCSPLFGDYRSLVDSRTAPICFFRSFAVIRRAFSIDDFEADSSSNSFFCFIEPSIMLADAIVSYFSPCVCFSRLGNGHPQKGYFLFFRVILVVLCVDLGSVPLSFFDPACI